MRTTFRFKYLVTVVVALCTALTAQTARAWDGSGTEADPYLIKTTADLDLLAHRVNGTHGETASEYEGTHFRLEADIAYDHTGLGDSESNYEAIGGNGNTFQYFQGIFDGQNHVVSGIRIYNGGANYQGLFGLIGYSAEVRNVILADAVITGYNHIGAIVGHSYGTVADCHVLNTVTVHANHNNVWWHGGIAGDNDGTVTRCTSAAALTTADGISTVCVGGIVGDNGGTVTHCIYFGTTLEGATRVGAIAGQNDKGTVETCYFTDTAIRGKDDATTFDNAASTVGFDKGGTVTNSGLAHTVTLGEGVTFDADATGDGRVTAYGNFALSYNDGTATTIYGTAGSEIALAYSGATPDGYLFGGYTVNSEAISGSTFTMPDQDVDIAASLAPIDWATQSEGTAADPYLIYNKDQLDLLAHRVNGTHSETASDYSGKHFRLEADIAYDHTGLGDTNSNYEAIGRDDGTNNFYFRGTFDGQNHVVSGIRIYKGGKADTDTRQGLFGQIDSPAEVKNVIIADATITGHDRTGAIVGHIDGGTVTNCHALATVTIRTVERDVWYHGGIVGRNSGTVTRCTSAASLTTTGSDSEYIGGIAGCNYGTVTECIYLGTTLNGSKLVGAIAGHTSGTVGTSYYTDTAIQGKNDRGTALDNAASTVGSIYTSLGSVANSGLAHTVTLGDGVTLDANATGDGSVTAYGNFALSYNDGTATTIYSTAGSEIALAYNAPDGYQLGYIVNGEAISGSTFTMPDQDVDITASLAPIDYWSGSGTEDDPYVIEYSTQLDLLAHRVNGTHGETANDYEGKYFRLAADIAYDYTGLGDTDSNYEAIGGYYDGNERSFKGFFDGQNHVVSGIRIYKGGNDDSDRYQGLFGLISIPAEVKNVILDDAIITGHYFVGIIVGYIGSATVTDCHALATTTVHAVKDIASYHGGIAGMNDGGTVTRCTSAATLTTAVSNSSYHGGIAGFNFGTITDCIYLGSTLADARCVGAITGYNGYTVETSYFTDTAIQGKDNDGAALDNAVSAVGDNTGTVAEATVGPALRNDADNSTFLTLMAARTEALTAVNRTEPLVTTANLALHGRTIYKDGSWNTLCLPFDVNNFTGTPLEGATVKTLASTSFSSGTLTMTFSEDQTSITAGTPYIVKWAADTDIENPVFNGVSISDATANVETDYADFVGSYSPVGIYTAEKTNLYLGADNTLYYPTATDMQVNAFRGYFQLKQGLTAGDPADPSAGVRAFVLNLGDGDNTTGILSIDHSPLTIDHSSDAWYSIDGRRLNGKPTQKGIYINNGRKVVMK